MRALHRRNKWSPTRADYQQHGDATALRCGEGGALRPGVCRAVDLQDRSDAPAKNQKRHMRVQSRHPKGLLSSPGNWPREEERGWVTRWS